MPDIVGRLRREGTLGKLSPFAPAPRARAVEGSYMPCFLAGESFARVLAEVLDVPLSSAPTSRDILRPPHGRPARPELMDVPHLAWHCRGAPPSVLVEPDGRRCKSRSVSAAQAIISAGPADRPGRESCLGLPFPAGKSPGYPGRTGPIR
jgi:N6-L-threonylcarbamoyladenine synthase